MDEREACERLRLIGNELRQNCKSRGIDCETCDRSQAALDHAIATIERERWRPIAEAPKDGTELLLTRGDRVTFGRIRGSLVRSRQKVCLLAG